MRASAELRCQQTNPTNTVCGIFPKKPAPRNDAGNVLFIPRIMVMRHSRGSLIKQPVAAADVVVLILCNQCDIQNVGYGAHAKALIISHLRRAAQREWFIENEEIILGDGLHFK